MGTPETARGSGDRRPGCLFSSIFLQGTARRTPCGSLISCLSSLPSTGFHKIRLTEQGSCCSLGLYYLVRVDGRVVGNASSIVRLESSQASERKRDVIRRRTLIVEFLHMVASWREVI